MNCNSLKLKITSIPLERQELIFYFAQKYAKTKPVKKTRSPEHRSKTQSTSEDKIRLISKSKPILSFKKSNDVNKVNLSTIETLKKEVQYLQQENIEKYQMKSKNLEVQNKKAVKNTSKSQQKDTLHKTTIENWKKVLVQRQFSSKLSLKRKVNTTVAQFVPLFQQQSVIKFTNNNILASNTMYLPNKRSKTSVARKYFGSAKKISENHSQIRFSQRPLRNEKIRQKTEPSLSLTTFNF